ncbi:hypothetical protein Pint_10998 [Pistacia integerrima]|uniref:Uncharacterized protein n=1 Tax=Pistacia integerrima TaxID=434235 RepID=A0ACC0XI58_9ROSI|nr:hypothetical protein Pint_10998 [Pistacia integerrima]
MARNYVRDNVPLSRFGILVAQLESTSELNQRVGFFDELNFTEKKTASVVGGTGYVASLLIKLLLQKGYSVNTTDVMEEKCGSAVICFVSFLLEILDSKADGRNKYLGMIYVWAAAGKHPDLEKHCVKGLFRNDILKPKCTFALPDVDQREMPRRALQENPMNFILSPPKIPDLCIAEKNLDAAVVDCCIGIPVYFTDLQRRAVLDAATIAGLHPLCLIHETTATTLAYGIYKTDLPENDQPNVAFVDVGNSSFQSLPRLRAACEKLKKGPSANPKAPLNIECLMYERDVRGFIKRDEFERISAPILDRVKRPLEKALAETGHSVENIHMVDVVGSGSRVPSIMKILTEFFGKEPRRTMNAICVIEFSVPDEQPFSLFLAKAILIHVNDSFPFSIALSWKGSAPEVQNEAADNQQSTIVFPKGNPIPSVKALTFYRADTFTLDVQ